MQRRLKKPVVYSLYGLSFILLILGVVGLMMFTQKSVQAQFNYISKGLFDNEENIQVVAQGDIIHKPYLDQDVNLVKSYYDFTADSSAQENSLIYYENTYMQSTGASYSKGDTFDVVSILPGEVTEVREDDMVGNSITISHDNGITSVYQSISDINVKKGEKVGQGYKIATSSTSNISADLKNHLYFELMINGECVDPELYYEKSTSEV